MKAKAVIDSIDSFVAARGMTYLRTLPTTVPSDQRLVHNRVQPTRRLGSRGFRAWLVSADHDGLEVCGCAWAPELGPHFRVRLAEGRR